MKKLSIILTFAFLMLVISSPVNASPSSQWTTFHGNQARTGFSESKLPSSANILWEISTDELKKYGITEFEIFVPIIDKNKVFFSTQQVFAADLKSGKILWNYKGERTNFYAGPGTVGNGKLFVRVNNSNQLKDMTEGFIYALDEDSGKFLWKYQTKAGLTHSNPLFADSKVFVGDELGFLYAIDANNGKLVWLKKLEADRIHSSPAYEEGVIYVGTETGNTGSYLYALDARDGNILWQFEADQREDKVIPNLIHGTPAISNGVVYFGSENGWFYALNKNDGKLIWKKLITTQTRTKARQAAGAGLVGVSTAPALGYGKIFVSTWEGKFLALSQKDGSILWEHQYGNEGSDSSAVLADEKVCLGSHYLDFYCFDQETGKVLWKKNLGGPSAALADGILVVPNTLAGAESSGPILLAFSDKNAPNGLSKIPQSAKNKIVTILTLTLSLLTISLIIIYRITRKKIKTKQTKSR